MENSSFLEGSAPALPKIFGASGMVWMVRPCPIKKFFGTLCYQRFAPRTQILSHRRFALSKAERIWRSGKFAINHWLQKVKDKGRGTQDLMANFLSAEFIWHLRRRTYR